MAERLLVPVLTRRMLWVDAAEGDDSTGVRGDGTKPFATCLAAQEAAQSGDTILVMPGDYTCFDLGKDGVNWDVVQGATFSPGADRAVFSNRGENLSFDVTGGAEVLNGLALNIEGSSGTIRAQFLKVKGGITVVGSNVQTDVSEDITGDVMCLDASDFTLKCRSMDHGTLLIGNVSSTPTSVKIYADTLNHVGVFQDIGGGRPSGKTDFHVSQITGPDITSGFSKGYAILVNDGYFVAHNCEIRNGPSNKLVGVDTGAALIMENCTVIRSAGSSYCVDRDGFPFSDVLRIIGRLTSNAPLDPGLTPYWGGQFVHDASIGY